MKLKRWLTSAMLAIQLVLLSATVIAQDDFSESENAEFDRLVRQTVEQPREFENGIRDISNTNGIKAMTGEMARFYLAVAAVEFTHCLTSGNALQCKQFMESLKDPVGHIGFALFMKTNHMTVNLANTVTRGKIAPGMASYMGLAAGMMAQSIFQDIYYHPKVQELFRLRRIQDPIARKQRRKEILNELWTLFKTNTGKYLWSKVPNVLGLMGAAYLSHKTVQVLEHVFGRGSRLVKFMPTRGSAMAVLRFGRNFAKHRRAAKAGFKLIWKGSRLVRVHPVVAIGSYLAETIIFLVWAPIIEHQVVKLWDRNGAILDTWKAKRALDTAIDERKSVAIIRRKAEEVRKGFDKFRESIMSKAELTKMKHLVAIQDVDKNFTKMVLYYEWLTNGMDMNSELWKLNEHEFHETGLINEINESSDYAESFFCGKSTRNAVRREVGLAGIPVPFSYSFTNIFDENRTYYENMRANQSTWVKPTGIKIDPFKVYRVAGVCERDLRRANGGSRPGSYDDITCPVQYDFRYNHPIWEPKRMKGLFCRVHQTHVRQHILRTSMVNGRNVEDDMKDKLDEKAGEIMRKAWSQRDLMLFFYEKEIRKELAEGLSGKQVELEDNDSLEFGSNKGYRPELGVGGTLDAITNLATGLVSSLTTGGGLVPLGFIPHVEYENRFWGNYNVEHRRYKPVWDKIFYENNKKKRAAQNLLDYTKQDYSQRVREHQFFEEIPKKDWEKIVRTLRDYIIP